MMGEQAAADGNKTAIICASNKGDSSQDDRIKGFTESFESAGGKVLGVSHSNDPSEAVSKASDLITANMDADCLYGSGGDFLNGAVNALENFPDLDIMVYGTDITPDFIELVANGKIDGLNGGHFVECSIATALLVNYLDGHPILDENGKPPVFTNLKWVTVTPETVSNYQEYWIDGHPFTDDAYKNMLWRNNPEVNYQYFYDLCENYSMESIIASRQ
jgi:ribose transport system substrate-binding protein